jgi:hypothetical protein
LSLSERLDSMPHSAVSCEDRSEGKSESLYPAKVRRWGLVGLFLTILLFGAIRWRFRDMPLERDEGEYAYAGQLILQGIPPYQIAYNMKLPGTYAAYAVIMEVFGQTAAGIRTGLLAANVLTILLVYVLGKRLYGNLTGVVAGASYGLLSLGPWVNGFAGHATHFVVLAGMAGLWMLLRAIEERHDWKILSAGLLFGLAFLMKQPGAAFGMFGALYLLETGGWRKGKLLSSIRRLVWFGAGAAVPFGVTALVLWRAGVFAKFWFWTVIYAYQYGTNVKGTEGWRFFVENFSKVFLSAVALWILAAAGLISLLGSRRAGRNAAFLLGLLFFSSAAVAAGLYFRGHYFILLLPAVSLLAGVAVSSSADWVDRGRYGFWRYVPLAVFVLAFAISLFQEKYFFFQADPISASRYVYPKDPFPEAVAVGNYIQQHSSPADRIALLGSEPQILFYSQRRSATGYLYGYSLTEEQKYAATMQREAISEIEAANPKYLAFIADWAMRPHSETAIFAWYRRYVTQNYELTGVMRVGDGLQLRSEDEVRAASGLTGAIFLFRRRSP